MAAYKKKIMRKVMDNMFGTIFSGLLSIGQWETVYFTEKSEDFYAVQYKLRDGNIRFKTKITDNNARGRYDRANSVIGGRVNNYYEIFVKKDDIGKANEIIHHR